MTPWQELSGSLAEKQWFNFFNANVLSHLGQLSPEKPVLIACSGGADSVFLTLALYAGMPNAADRLHLLHFNHQLRGRESDQDAEFVHDLAVGLGIPCQIGQAPGDLPQDEASLRKARYEWMVEKYVELDAGGLCLGHHADDVVESLLMAVLTGSGPAGMASPLPVKQFSDGHVRLRPMLELRRDQIVEFLKSAGVPWCEDASNLNTAYTRNWLRKECIPMLQDRIPQDIYAGTRRTRERMQECVDALDEATLALGLDYSSKEGILASRLQGEPAALIRRALMSWWLRHYPEQILNKFAMDSLVALLQEGKSGMSVEIGRGQALWLDGRGFLAFRSEVPGFPEWNSGCHWHWPAGPIFLPAGTQLVAQKVYFEQDEEPPYKKADPESTAWINWDGRTLQVRQWRPGDRYQPLGAPGSRKLQDIFVDAKLSPEQKRHLPVLVDMEGSILWVPGFPPGEAFRLLPESKSGLKLTYISQ